MFEASEATAQMVNSLYETLCGMNRGDILTDSAIHRAIHIKPGHPKWYSTIQKARNKFQSEKGIATVALGNGEGYQLLTEDGQLCEGPRRIVRARRQLVRGERSIAALPDDNLTPHQKRVKMFMSDDLCSARSAMQRSERFHKKSIERNEPLPRRPFEWTPAQLLPLDEKPVKVHDESQDSVKESA